MRKRKGIFDGHVHMCFRVPVRESVYIYDREFEELGVDKFCILCTPIYSFVPGVELDRVENLKGLYFKSAFAPDGYAFAGLEHDYSMPVEERAQYYLDQVKEYTSVGFDGIKMLEGYPPYYKKLGVKFCDPVYKPFFKYLETNGIPTIMHLAHPKLFWDREKIPQSWIDHGNYYDETYPSFYDFLDDILATLDLYPNLRLTLAHTGFMSDEIEYVKKFLSYPNTSLDFTPGGEQILEICNGENRDWWINFIKENSTRFKYGTDLYQFEYTSEEKWQKAIHTRPDMLVNFITSNKEHLYVRDKFRGVKFPKKIQKQILRENLLRELGAPKPVDFNWCLKKVEELKKLHPDTETLNGYDLKCMGEDFETLKKYGYLTFFG